MRPKQLCSVPTSVVRRLQQLAARPWIALALLLVIFDLLKVSAIRYGTGDEFIYHYMGRLVARGKVPYRDFLFTHPPLQLVAPTIVFATVGFSFTVLKLIPILVANSTAVLLFEYTRRAATPLVGVLAAALFLFSTTGHVYASVYMGQETTVLLIVGGLVTLQRGRPLGAGVWLGVAALYGLYAGCAVLLILVMLARTDWTALSRFLIGFTAVFSLGTVTCFAIAGTAYWQQTVVFQTLKVPDPVNAKWPIVAEMALLDPAILALALVPPRRGLGLPSVIGCAYAVAIVAFSDIHINYAELCIPFLVPAGADNLLRLTERFRVPRISPSLVAGVVASVLCAIGVVRARAFLARGENFPLRDVAAEIRSLTEPGETVIGESSVTPLLALLADRDIVADYADTTGMNYLTHIANMRRAMERMRPGWPGVIVLRNIYLPTGPSEGINIVSGPMMDREFAEFVYANFTAVRSYQRPDKPQESILLYVTNDRARQFNGVR